MKKLFLSIFTLFVGFSLYAQQGHRIEVEIKDYDQSNLYLAYYYGDKQYVKDTVQRDANGRFVFKGEEALEPGVYMVVMEPENNFFQLIVDEDEQNYSLSTSKDNYVQDISFQYAPDNELFYEYLQFLEEKRPQAAQLQEELSNSSDEVAQQNIQSQLDQINLEVREYQDKLIQEHPKSFTAAIIKANLAIDYPEFEGSPEEVQMSQYRYTKDHYFDNLDLSDPRMLRTPFLFSRIDNYVQRLTYQNPDSLIQSIDWILNETKPAEETFKFYLIHFLNTYARSKIIGMDAVYVHLALNYYATGQADWTDPEQLEKIVSNAKTLEPLLIGKVAPDLKLQRPDGLPVRLHEVNSPYTVLYFWRYDCGACKTSTPIMKRFFEKYKDQGVQLMAVCMKTGDEVGGCWDYVNEQEIGDWLHTVDPNGTAQVHAVYDVKSTPTIYILDQEKRIVLKRLGADQLDEVMGQILEGKR
ncbi:redoxin domain-containing protein [Algoriphagus kandeliae]|uniref:Redoxin domain-containing protein n=1 Tax=Algoriphagus kandeliae TaxID=2562278 RepID=A0A4Y9QNY9_9BACT|nr:TlpA family protein disulfide reductase [Algoriphagus kandeliae]TFV94309.1 redoxin domain-containing protein [Algoriphagus kandeliae]